MITFSKREDYGMMLMTELLKAYKKRLVPLSKVSRTHKIPLLFLRNIASDLRRAGFIKAVEGRNGGYVLAKDPRAIRFGKVLEALSNRFLFSCCQDTPDGHCRAELCPHGFSPRRLANEFLESVYYKSLAEVIHHPRSPFGHLGGD